MVLFSRGTNPGGQKEELEPSLPQLAKGAGSFMRVRNPGAKLLLGFLLLICGYAQT